MLNFPGGGGALDHPILLFDGVCNLCNAGVSFVISRDRRGLFRFASLQSAAGQALLRQRGLPVSDFRSFVMVVGDDVFERSTAALRVARGLGGGYVVLSWLVILPRSFRDAVYDWIARNRYRWFGRRDQCRLPQPQLAPRFLETEEDLVSLVGSAGAPSAELLPSGA